MADVQATNDALISAERVSKVFPLPEGHGTFNVLVEWLRHARLSLSLQPSYEFGGLTDVTGTAQRPLSAAIDIAWKSFRVAASRVVYCPPFT